MAKPKRVREPVQVYLDESDRALLEALAKRSSLSRAELLRRGLRRLSEDMLADGKPGNSIALLVGVLSDPDVPPDLSVRHDDYLYGDSET